MATILQPINFTDEDSKEAVKRDGSDWVNGSGDNVFLAMGGSYGTTDGYYGKLLRDYNINYDDVDLANPVIYNVEQVLICYVETEIFKKLLADSRATFEGQNVLTGKYQDKLREAKNCLKNWLSQLDENAFFDKAKGTDSNVVTRFGRF